MYFINNPRLLEVEFYTLYDEPQTGEEKHFSYFRMSRSSFDELLERQKEVSRSDIGLSLVCVGRILVI